MPKVANEDKKRLNKYVLREGDIVFSRVGSVDRCSYVDKLHDGWMFSGRCLRIRPKEEINPMYLYYYFCTEETKQFIRNIAVGATMPSINTKLMGEVKIVYPDKIVQKKIVSLLESIDDKIECNNTINKNLEKQVSTIYQSWFEDFELTDGIMPTNWHFQELSSIANILSGKRPPVKTTICNQETSIPIIGATSIMGFTSKANHTDKILVIGRVGTHGVVQRFNSPCWTSDNTLVITSPFYEFTNQILHRIDYSALNCGSTQSLITQGDVKKLSVLIPDKDFLIKFENIACSLMARWDVNNTENLRLATLRDTILPKLMSGSIDVAHIDI